MVRRAVLVGLAGWLLACMGLPTGGPSQVRVPAPRAESPRGEGLQWDEVVEGQPRQARVSLPPGLSAERPVPLVLALHGGGGDMDTMPIKNGWRDTLDAQGWIGVYPQTGKKGRTRREDVPPGEQDDVVFYAHLLDRALGELPVDPSRVYVVGFSAGGRGAYLLANRHAERITAFAAHSSTIAKRDDDPARVDPVHNELPKLSVLHIHGQRDDRIPYAGGSVAREDGSSDTTLPAMDAIQRWAEQVGAVKEPGGPQGVPGAPSRLKSQRWVAPSGHVVQLVVDPQLEHQWGRGWANELIVEFFESAPPKTLPEEPVPEKPETTK